MARLTQHGRLREQILDEATSALDAASASTFQAALDHVVASGTCTVIVIAHRLATVQRCRQILVLDQGSIVERGTHTELLAANGAYTDLVQKQDLLKHQPEQDALGYSDCSNAV